MSVEHSRLPAEFQLNAPISPPRGTRLRYPTDGALPKIDGFEAEVANIRKLAASPFVNRLNHIKQLSTASLSSALGGTHTRLEHTLGAYDIAVRMLRKANEYMIANEDSNVQYRLHRSTVIRAALFLAFLHDAFHGPFGHVLDPIKGVLLPDKLDTRIDNTARHLEFKRAVEQQTGIVSALARFVFPADADAVLQVAYFLGGKATSAIPSSRRTQAVYLYFCRMSCGRRWTTIGSIISPVIMATSSCSRHWPSVSHVSRTMSESR